MASSSSSSTACRVKDRVFLNFRGVDVRENFIRQLHGALLKEGIETFIDDDLNKGDEVATLLKEIKVSKILVAVISEHYANSRWCLDELVTILECKNNHGHIVIPVFYRIKKTDVETQSGKFGEAFAEIKIKEHYKGKIPSWESALGEVTKLTSWDSDAVENDFVLAGNIVKDILKRLKDILTSDNKNEVGLKLRVEELEKLVSDQSEKTFTLGLWGGAGMGKTTLARAIFDKISGDFEVVHFVENVKEESERRNGLTILLQDLRAKIPADEASSKKVLIVFDDVTNPNQIEFLIGGVACFGRGSLVIITARDRSIFKGCGVDKEHQVERLDNGEDTRLFRRCAFGENNPTRVFSDLSKKIVEYAKGVPLALKILGSCLHGKRKQDWERVLQKIEKSLPFDIHKALKISYEELGFEEQKLFKEIVLNFDGEDIDEVKRTLNATFMSIERGIKVLVQRFLISIIDNKITMLNLVKEMGRELFNQNCVEMEVQVLGRRARL